MKGTNRSGFVLPAVIMTLLVLGILILPLIQAAMIERIAAHGLTDALHARRAAESALRMRDGQRWDRPPAADGSEDFFEITVTTERLPRERVLLRAIAAGRDGRRAQARADGVYLRFPPEALLAWLSAEEPDDASCPARTAWLRGDELFNAATVSQPMPFFSWERLLQVADLRPGQTLDLDAIAAPVCDEQGCDGVPVIVSAGDLEITGGSAQAVVIAGGQLWLGPDARLRGVVIAGSLQAGPGAFTGLAMVGEPLVPMSTAGDPCAALDALSAAAALRRYLVVDSRVILPAF
jgi:hypothetical protein